MQRKELELTRNEFKDGNTTAKVQQIDNAFFNMLSLHNQIVNSLKLTEGDTFVGRSAIEELKKKFEFNYFCNNYVENQTPDHSDLVQLGTIKVKKMADEAFKTENFVAQTMLDKVYGNFHNKYGEVIGHYMRNNYRIVKFIVENVVDNEQEKLEIIAKTERTPIVADKRYYFGMLRAQWSNSEFELILYTKRIISLSH